MLPEHQKAHLHGDLDHVLCHIMNQEPGRFYSLGILRWPDCAFSSLFQWTPHIDPLDLLAVVVVLFGQGFVKKNQKPRAGLLKWGTNYSNRSAQDGNGAETFRHYELKKKKSRPSTVVHGRK